MSARMSRRSWMTAAGMATMAVPAVAAIDGFLITPRRLVTSTHRFGEPSGSRIRLLQISDVHLQRIGGLEERLLAAVHDAAADLIVLTGDMIDRADRLWQLEMLLRELPRGPRTVAILGNWEYWSGVRIPALERTYDRHGIELLVNRSIEVETPAARLRITGLDDLRAGAPDAAAALADAPPARHHLVLAHCPASRDRVSLPGDHAAALLLAGHTHGGQVAPLGVPLVRPIGSGRYLAGWYRDDGLPPMYVSRGIGTSKIPVRIGSSPELVQIDWGVGA